MKKAVVLLSGGLDSATTLAIAKREGYEIHTISFDYGQRHKIELDRAQKISKTLGALDHKVVLVDLTAFGGSALTSDTPVPKGAIDEPMAEGIPVTYVPARNTIFLSMALAYAETIETGEIFMGVNAVDYSGYPDCRPEYIKAFEAMANLATKGAVEGNMPVTIHTPLIKMTKGEIIKKGIELKVDYSITLSCYDPASDGTPCGQCESCRLRAKGFSDVGMDDPAL